MVNDGIEEKTNKSRKWMKTKKIAIKIIRIKFNKKKTNKFKQSGMKSKNKI
jgi:hypothetical protein